MTREEAVIILDGFKNNPLFNDTHLQAFNMAISALSENKCFDGMTNGEVMNYVLRKVFPRMIFIRGINECNKTKSIVYAEEWENAPYKAEKTETCKGCLEPCIMYEPDMRACKKKVTER